MPQSRRRAMYAASVAIVSLVTAALLVRQQSDTGIGSLVQASAAFSHRPTAGRLSGGFPYKSYPVRVTRNAAVSADLSQWRLMKAAEAIERRVAVDATPGHLHALAVAHLLTGYIDDAIAVFERILGDPPTDAALVGAIRHSQDAALLADLAAAYYERGSLEDDPAEIALAFEAAERSWRITGTPEAAWNRALAMDSFHVRHQAREAWRTYLELDPKSAYGGEARHRLAKLSEPTDEQLWERASGRIDAAAARGDRAEVERLVRRFPQRARDRGEKLVESWSIHWLSGNFTEAKRSIDVARAIGAALSAHSGERFLLDTVQCIDGVAASVLRSLATAHSQYAAAYAAYRNGEYVFATRTMTSAEATFLRVHSPYAVQTAITRASCAFMANDLNACVEIVQQIRQRRLRDHGWHAAAALADWVYSLPTLASGDIGATIEARQAARQTFSRAGELEHAAAMEALLAEVYEFAGDRHRAWRHRREAMRIAAHDGSSKRIHVTFDEAAEAALHQSRIATALLFQEVMAEDARRQGNPVELADSQRWRAGALLTASDFAEARREIAEGRRVAASIRDGAIRQRITADLDLFDAQALLHSDPRAAGDVAARAVQFFTSMGKFARVAEATLTRARSAVRLGDAQTATSLLQETLPAIESQRSTIEDLRLRLTYLGQRSAAYNELAALLIDRGSYTDALAVAEQAKGRAILDGAEPQSRHGEPPEIGALQQAIPPKVSVVAYASLPDYVGAWVIKRDSIQFRRLTMPRIAPRPRRGKVRPPMTVEARQLIERQLLHPLWPWLEGSTAVIFAAPFDGVPFASLRSPDGRRLIEHLPVATAPSVATWAVLSGRQCPPAPVTYALVISQNAAGGRPLPAASAEAASVASFARTAVTLSGSEITPERVAEELPRADLIQIIAHGAPSDRPFASGVHAFSDGTLWTADHVMDLRLQPCASVVLSGCATAEGTRVGEESVTSLANSFLASGARSVIATLWDVDDAATAEFMRAFHAQLAPGRGVGEAFRNAQLANAGAHGDSWAAFQLIGAL